MAFVKSSKTQKELLVKYLRGTSRSLTEAQASAIFGIKNLRARISELRQDGYRVRTGKTKSGKTNYFISRRKNTEFSV